MTNQVNQSGIISQQANAVKTAGTQKTLKDFVVQMEGQIAKALPKVITPERFTRIALSALSSNPNLAKCERNSFLGALMQSAALGLEINTPLQQAFLIPFNNTKKGVTECQFQIGYKGLLDLAYRSGEFASIYAQEVYENDIFDYEYGLETKLVHKPKLQDRGDVIAYYAVFKLKNGGSSFVVMSRDDVLRHAKKFSKSFNSGPWQSDFNSMAKKTCLKALLKYAPLRSDFITAAETADEHTATYNEASQDVVIDMETGEVVSEAKVEEVNENE
jgi:recombination protein RecT